MDECVEGDGGVGGGVEHALVAELVGEDLNLGEEGAVRDRAVAKIEGLVLRMWRLAL